MRSVITKSSLLAMALCSSLTVLSFNYAHAVDPAGIAEVTVGTGFIDVQVHTEFDHAVLRVAGPDGYAAHLQVLDGSKFITADLLLDAEDNELNQRLDSSTPLRWQALPDGIFSYEVVLFDSEGSSKVVTGSFRIEAGQVVDFRPAQPIVGADSEATEGDQLGALDQPGLLQRAFGSLLNILIPSAHAQPGDFDNFVSIKSPSGTGTTRLNLNATDSISITPDAWRLMNDINSKTFRIVQGTGSDVRFLVNQSGNVGIGTIAPTSRLHVVDSVGFQLRLDSDTHFTRLDSWGGAFTIAQAEAGEPFTTQLRISGAAPENSLVINNSGRVGVGTASPSALLDLRGSESFPEVRLQHTSAPSGVGVATDAEGNLRFRAPSGSTKMTVAPDGNVGIGTITPGALLHIQRSNNTAQVLVSDTGASGGSAQTMFSLSNNGHPKFRLQDTSQSDVRWEFRTIGTQGVNEAFIVNKIGSGVAEMRLFAGGDVEFGGNVTANGVLLTSTRDAKTDIQPINERELLEKLASLDIKSWRYKTESEGINHIGPIAEEFQQVFGLSDGKTLNMIDTNGIAFAAIKAVYSENQQLLERIERLENSLYQ